MKFTTPARRLLAAGAVSALAAGTLVGATSTAALAESAETSYTCEYAALGLGPWEVTVISEVPAIGALPSPSPAGYPIEAGLPVTNSFTVPDNARTTMQDYSVENLSFPDYAGSFGDASVKVEDMTATVSSMTDNGDGTWTFNSNGTTSAFETPTAGTFDITAPSAFNLAASVGANTVSVPCTLQTGSAPGIYRADVTVVKNSSESRATAVNSPVRKGEVAKVKVKVAGPVYQTPSGKVLLKKGAKTLTKGMLNDNGIVVLKTKALPVGKTTLTTAYKGDGYTKPSRDTVVFTVKR